jgi:hypothetical protein
VLALETPASEAIDIDTADDLALAEARLAIWREQSER